MNEELREALARALRPFMPYEYRHHPDLPSSLDRAVDAVLALPEVAALIGLRERVEAVADWYDGGGEGVPRLAGRGATSNAYAGKRIRAALDTPASSTREAAT